MTVAGKGPVAVWFGDLSLPPYNLDPETAVELAGRINELAQKIMEGTTSKVVDGKVYVLHEMAELERESAWARGYLAGQKSREEAP